MIPSAEPEMALSVLHDVLNVPKPRTAKDDAGATTTSTNPPPPAAAAKPQAAASTTTTTTTSNNHKPKFSIPHTLITALSCTGCNTSRECKCDKENRVGAPPALVPLRMPQKRLATELLTNLVDQIHEPKKLKLTNYDWQDLDEEDADDPLMCLEYVNEIFLYFYELEQRMLPLGTYLTTQKHLKPKMRLILVDWLVEMHLKFRLLPELLFLAINIMDRFMLVEVVQVDKLQLLATGLLFIAAKYEEVFLPSVKNYAYFTDGLYTEQEILDAEKYILKVLRFDLNYPNPMNFLRRISKADDYDVQLRTLGKYLLEVTVVDHRFIGFKPSLCCAAAMYLARLILGKNPVWNGNLIHYLGGYRVADLRQTVEMMVEYLVAPVEHDEFFKKYATKKFMKALMLCRLWGKRWVADDKDLFDDRFSTNKVA